MRNTKYSKTWENPHINYRKNTDAYPYELLYLCNEG
ncbi:hypothetical protein QFZ37_001021 [Chryseobacterium ginsenosidimutans]|nr:hypothetical protein [Chryseobacterium ginsenosidimutans]